MTIPENQWGYHKDWSLSYVKNPTEVLARIVHAVSMGGNMVVNFGPQPDGDFRPEEKKIADFAKTLTGEQTQVTETTRNEYNVSLPKNMPQEPFVIKLEVKDAQKTQDKYREALT